MNFIHELKAGECFLIKTDIIYIFDRYNYDTKLYEFHTINSEEILQCNGNLQINPLVQ